ncbi:MAG: 30S ribosomal protein S6 [Oscillospiraceae bacterium]|nr:30S ribosomal protein S6 [[Eubacterium] saphenum]
MAKLDSKYEAMVVLSVKTNDEEQIKALINKFSDLIKNNGTLEGVDEWGKRKLAYDINYESEGYYVLYNFESKPDFPAELERVISITDGVLRSMVVLRK